MRRRLIAPATFFALLLLASRVWAPPPPPPPRPPTPPPRPPVTPVRPPTGGGGSGIRPPITSAKPNFNKGFEAARAKSAADAAQFLRTQVSPFFTRTERTAMLNALALQMLRHQKQAATLTELRRLRADWVAIGPGAGLDPLIAMELEAAESAAERLLLAEVLKLIRDGQFIEADTKLDALGSPRFLPAAVVQELPTLHAELKKAGSFIQVQKAVAVKVPPGDPMRLNVAEPLSRVPEGSGQMAVYHLLDCWHRVDAVRTMLEQISLHRPKYSVEYMNETLKNAQSTVGPEVAGKLRVELSARLFLIERTEDAAKLLEDDVDPFHAAAMLADLRAVILGRGELTLPQVAGGVPWPDLATPPPQARAVLPPDQLAKWKPPARKPGESTIDVALADARKQFKAAVDAEVSASTTKVNAAADRIRAALAAEAGPVKAFIEKVEAALGRPFATPVERQLALAAGTRGFTVAETVGVLSADANRPAAAARLILAVPVFTNPGSFAATVELSGRAPAAFAPHPDAGFKLMAARDRARIRDAFTAVLGSRAAKAAAGQQVPPLERSALEAEVAKRLGLPATDALTPAECVQGLLDVCRDWADDHTRLATEWRELHQAIADAESELTNGDEDELKSLLTTVKVRRLSVQVDRKRREVGLSDGCRLLGEYGPTPDEVTAWLRAQTQGDAKPWSLAAIDALKKLNGK